MRVDVAFARKLKQALIVLPILLPSNLGMSSAFASDFSQAQTIYVPPSLITRYDATSLAGMVTTPNYVDSTLGLISSPNLSGANNIQASDVAAAISNIPGISNIKSNLQKLLQQGDLGKAEALASQYFKVIPAPILTQLGNAATAAAQKYLQNHDLGAAGDQIRQALAADPSNKTSQSVYGQILKASGLNPNSASDHITLGNSLAGQGKYKEAVIEYNNALAIKPSAEAHVCIGNIAYTLGRADLARNEYEKALSVDPQSEFAFRQRGLLKYALQDQIGANTDLSKALSLSPTDRLAGESLLELWRRQLAANPNDPNGHLGLARSYLLIGDLDSAQTEYQEVARLDPNNSHLPAARNSFKLALAKREANNSFEAAKTLDHEGAIKEAHIKIGEAIAYYPRDVKMLLFQGELSEKLALYDEAHQAYLSVLKEDPKNITAAARLKKIPNKISENVSAKIEKAGKNGDAPAIPPLRDMLTPETPMMAPSTQLRPQLPLGPQAAMPSTAQPLSDNGAVSSVAPMDSLSNFICSVRELAINKQLEMKEIDRVNKESLKAAQADIGQTRLPFRNSQINVSGLPSTLPSVAFSGETLDPSLGF
jgi:tetratricopeptide (TPR) repeat protein